MARVQSLSVRRTPLSDASMSHIATLSGLRILDISGTGISGESLVMLSKFRCLTGLCVDGSQVTEVGIAHISACPSIETIVVTGATDETVAHLQNIRTLLTLKLHESTLSAKGIQAIQSIPGLRRIVFLDCDIADALLLKLQTEFRNCQIVHVPDEEVQRLRNAGVF